MADIDKAGGLHLKAAVLSRWPAKFTAEAEGSRAEASARAQPLVSFAGLRGPRISGLIGVMLERDEMIHAAPRA